MRVSHTDLAGWRRCRCRYNLERVERWRPNVQAMGLANGTFGHRVLGAYYGGQTMEQALAVETASLTPEDPVQVELLTEVLTRYALWAQTSADKGFCLRPNTTELRFEMPLGDHHELVGYIDGILERTDGTQWVLEHKFMKAASTKHVMLDMQASIYMLGCRSLDIPVQGLLYNVVRVSTGPAAKQEPALRSYVYRPGRCDDITTAELVQQADEVESFLSRSPEVRRRIAYRSPTRDCHWDCAFYPACIFYQESGQWDLEHGYHQQKEWKYAGRADDLAAPEDE